ncbi:sensor histidine kinase [Xanthomarina sp. F2636L]|uniref:sensor histidine kinase n=1 Tax=Xanthomarina sp. F2636L TaxID=2996018 RepID=UPI00225E41BC|nr:HAMP domain-containing sensor histidine kinase [Xanthomarina sp. F2636L]MCX7551406.1 HAMP domain-containing sensor histidine kinase [Xanthomarina sp. F2636L]
MKTYHTLSQISILKKYSYKFLFVAFLGIHIPLLGIIFYALFATSISTTTFILITLGLTLLATALTLRVLNALLAPIIKGEVALKDYVENNTLPNLPINYTDEVGDMLKNIQYTIECLDEVDKEKQDIIELISHDLRTPILQSLEVINFLKEDGDDAQQREENLNLLNEISTKQLKFLEEMLKTLKANHIEVGFKNFENLSVSEIINEIIADYKNRIDEKQLTVINTVPDDLMMYGHAIGMKQVFENLLNNAIKFSEKNDEIHISGVSDKNSVQIIIKDHGMGFNEQTKETLFSKFVPGHLGTSGEPTTGLGLYLTKKIVEKHRGTIQPFSDGQGKGAKFVVSIPK